MKLPNARVDAQGGRIDSATLKSYTETAVGGSSGTNSGTAYTVDLTTGNVFNVLLNANCTFTFPSTLTSGTAYTFTLVLRQDGGTRTATWPSSVIWPGGTAPVLSATGGIRDIFSFMTINGGTPWLGFAGGFNFGATPAATAYTLWAWGLGTTGQLGGANIINRSVTTQVGTLTIWSKIAGTGHFSLSTKSDGTLWAWGADTFGQLAQGDIVSRSSPVQVGGFITWSQIAEGLYHTLATKTDGTLWAWGRNSYGRLGQADIIDRSSPTQVGTLTVWSTVAAGGSGQHSLALKTDGTLWAWGRNTYGRLGLNDIIFRFLPVHG